MHAPSDPSRAVEVQIREAFKGVTRIGGVSWSEATVIDDQGLCRTPREARLLKRNLKLARARDLDQRWEDLVDDPSWDHYSSYGGFNFLDAIGFRYYLPAAMLRILRRGAGEFVAYAMTIDTDHRRSIVSLFTAPQGQAVANFVEHMIARTPGDDLWTGARYWRDVAEGRS